MIATENMANLLAGRQAAPTMPYGRMPSTSVTVQRVAFGTPGRFGSAFEVSFKEWHGLAISPTICRYRKPQGIDDPLFPGIDTNRQRRLRAREDIMKATDESHGPGLSLRPNGEKS